MTLFIQEVNIWIWSRSMAPETDALAWPHKLPLDTGWRHGSCDEKPLFPERWYWVMWASTWISGSQGEGLEGVCVLWPSWTLWACSDFTWAALEKGGSLGILSLVAHSWTIMPASVQGQGCSVSLRITQGWQAPGLLKPSVELCVRSKRGDPSKVALQVGF